MDTSIFDLYTAGLPLVLQWQTILWLLFGVVAGVVIGALPGMSATMGIAVMTPLTYGMDMGPSFALLMGVFCGAIYGGSITAVVANIPGAPSSMMTTLDGYPLGQQGKAGLAIGTATVASVIGGLISVVILSCVAAPLAKMALKFSAQEYFAVALIGLAVIAILAETSIIRGLISGVIGLLLATIGSDPLLGTPRFTFDNYYLLEGIQTVPVLIGFFGLVSALQMVEKKQSDLHIVQDFGRILPNKKEMKEIMPSIGRGSAIGVIIGAIPAAGGTIASIIAYGLEKRLSKHPEQFGKGCLNGIAAPESANNGASGGAMIPMLALGVPGDACTAILLGALTIKGLTPGPTLFSQHLDVVSCIYICLLFANILFFFVGIFGAKYISRVILVPNEYLAPCILVFCLMGAFAIRSAVFDIWTLLLIGVLGYIFSKIDLPASPVVLGFVLGSLFESGLRRGLMLSHGNFLEFFTRPISGICIVIAILVIFLPKLSALFAKVMKH